MNEARTLRLGLLLGPCPLRRWERLALRTALELPGIVLIGHARPAAPKRSFRSNLFFDRLVRAAGSGMLHVNESPDGFGPELSLQQLQAGRPDVILGFGGVDPASARIMSTHGTWCFANADGAPIASCPPGIRESIGHTPLVHFALVDVTNERTLFGGCFRSDPHDPVACCQKILAQAASWPSVVLGGLGSNGAISTAGDRMASSAIPVPGIFQMLSFHLGRSVGRSAVRRDGELQGEWNIGLLHQPIHVLLQEEGSMNVRWLPAPSKGKARLEPFGYTDGHGELNVLYRKADLATSTSSIARVRPKPDNILKRSRTMLDMDGAHTYPFVLQIEDRMHALCTSFAASRTDLYCANGTNDALEHRATILDQALHAPTLFAYNGKWWLMGTADPDGDVALLAFHARSPFGPFVQVGVGAVKCDVRSARPSGTPFTHEGRLYRPSLDASDPISPCVVLNRVTRLDELGFAEEAVRRITGFAATAYGLGVRTISAMGEVTLVDGLRSPTVTGSQANASRSRHRRTRSTNDPE